MTLNVQAFLDTLPMMGKGMGGVFVVIIAIAAVIALLRKVFPNKK